MDDLTPLADKIREDFERVNKARDEAYGRSRPLISLCARAIRAIHRLDWEIADGLLAETKTAAQAMLDGVGDYPALYYAGYTQDAMKEVVEANLVYAIIRQRPLPSPEDLNAEYNTYLNGMAEAATELRRRILDIMRHEGHNEEAERLLDAMDEIYSILVTFDFSDSITGGLRRRTDAVRAVLERTRGDVTTSMRQAALEEALEALEARL